jgi:hypothetical protein
VEIEPFRGRESYTQELIVLAACIEVIYVWLLLSMVVIVKRGLLILKFILFLSHNLPKIPPLLPTHHLVPHPKSILLLILPLILLLPLILSILPPSFALIRPLTLTLIHFLNPHLVFGHFVHQRLVLVHIVVAQHLLLQVLF